MKKKQLNAIKRYEQWVEDDRIWKTWEHEDYENTIVYEDIAGDIVCIQRNAEGKIIDAWEE